MTPLNEAWTDREINHEIAQLDTQFPRPADDPLAAARALIIWVPASVLAFWAPFLGCLNGWWMWT